MIIPYDTDAPIYHFPYMTISLIVVNVLVFVGYVYYPVEFIHLMLSLGNGIHPVEWVTFNFMHGDIVHLLGNMIFLWAFGIIVEGKLGLWRFLATYLTIGVIEGLFVQIIMLKSEPNFALGASGAIFGLLAMNFLWAPKNELSCFYWFWPFVGTTEFSIQFFAFIFIGWECFLMSMQNFEMSSAFLHVTGAVIGLGLAYMMLKQNWVDCEGWDWISLANKDLATQRMSPMAKAEKKKAESKFKMKKVKVKKTSTVKSEKKKEEAGTWDMKKK